MEPKSPIPDLPVHNMAQVRLATQARSQAIHILIGLFPEEHMKKAFLAEAQAATPSSDEITQMRRECSEMNTRARVQAEELIDIMEKPFDSSDPVDAEILNENVLTCTENIVSQWREFLLLLHRRRNTSFTLNNYAMPECDIPSDLAEAWQTSLVSAGTREFNLTKPETFIAEFSVFAANLKQHCITAPIPLTAKVHLVFIADKLTLCAS